MITWVLVVPAVGTWAARKALTRRAERAAAEDRETDDFIKWIRSD